MKNIFKVNGKIKFLPLIGLTIMPLLGSLVVWYLTMGPMRIYDKIKLPIFAPNSIVFSIVWPIIYLLMGIASYRIYMIRDEGKDVGTALFFYIIQLLLNYLWPFIFFSFRLYGLGFIELIILFIFVIITFVKFIKIDKIAGILLIPYLLWLIFAGTLNYFVWAYNEM